MQAVANTYAGTSAGQFLPAGVGGDVVRVMLLHRMKLPAVEVAASIVVERLFGLFALITVASMAIAASQQIGVDLPGRTEGVVITLLVAMAGALLLSFSSQGERVFSLFLRSVNTLPLRMRFLSKIHDLFLAYRRYAQRRATIALYFFLSIVEVLLVVVFNLIVCRSMNIDLGFLALMLIVPVTLIMQRLPVSLNGIGMQEGILGYFFMHAGYGLDMGVSFSIALRIFDLLILIPGGLVIWRHRAAASADPSRRS
jgi:uncharacterized protein (TIRG00374 family)